MEARALRLCLMDWYGNAVCLWLSGFVLIIDINLWIVIIIIFVLSLLVVKPLLLSFLSLFFSFTLALCFTLAWLLGLFLIRLSCAGLSIVLTCCRLSLAFSLINSLWVLVLFTLALQIVKWAINLKIVVSKRIWPETYFIRIFLVCFSNYLLFVFILLRLKTWHGLFNFSDLDECISETHAAGQNICCHERVSTKIYLENHAIIFHPNHNCLKNTMKYQS